MVLKEDISNRVLDSYNNKFRPRGYILQLHRRKIHQNNFQYFSLIMCSKHMPNIWDFKCVSKRLGVQYMKHFLEPPEKMLEIGKSPE